MHLQPRIQPHAVATAPGLEVSQVRKAADAAIMSARNTPTDRDPVSQVWHCGDYGACCVKPEDIPDERTIHEVGLALKFTCQVRHKEMQDVTAIDFIEAAKVAREEGASVLADYLVRLADAVKSIGSQA